MTALMEVKVMSYHIFINLQIIHKGVIYELTQQISSAAFSIKHQLLMLLVDFIAGPRGFHCRCP